MTLTFAFSNCEFSKAAGRDGLDFQVRDRGGLWRLGLEVSDKRRYAMVSALEVDLDAVGVVQYPPAERVGSSKTIYKWAKAYALHYSTNTD
jgi:hypothetical protein